MLLRLIFGLAKGLVLGALFGFGLTKAGIVAPGALFAYLSAAATGVLVGLVAGKPIWAKEAKVEAGMKAFVGALLGAGLMWACRRWLSQVPLAFSLGPLAEANLSLGEVSARGTLGGLSITSLPIIGTVLGAFYDADNTPEAAGSSDKQSKSTTRIAVPTLTDEAEDDSSVEDKRAQR